MNKAEQIKQDGLVKICVSCKSYWITDGDSPRFCGSCGASSFEPTHKGNFKFASNYKGVWGPFEKLRTIDFDDDPREYIFQSEVINAVHRICDCYGFDKVTDMSENMIEIVRSL